MSADKRGRHLKLNRQDAEDAKEKKSLTAKDAELSLSRGLAKKVAIPTLGAHHPLRITHNGF